MKQAIQRLKDEEIKKRALNIVKYQNFKTTIALSKIDVRMPKVIFESGVSYLKRGVEDKALSRKLKQELDDCVTRCVQPLTPNNNEQRKFRVEPYQTKEAKPPICNLPILKKAISSVFDYGVQVGNTIKIFDSEEKARLFLEGVNFLNNNVKGVLVEVELKVVKGE